MFEYAKANGRSLNQELVENGLAGPYRVDK